MVVTVMLVDSHCHINFPEFQDDLDDVMTRAREAGVGTFLAISTKLDQADDLLALTKRFADVYCTIGVHPHDAANYMDVDLQAALSNLVKRDRVVGIGETGLDYYYENSPREAQIESFKTHIAVSRSADLPLVIHTRDADADTLACLEFQDAKGVFHCFSGDLALAKAALDLGFYISFSGIITFKKADALREIVKYVPLERILVETDAPFLAPIPHRGQRNEPSFVIHTAQMVASLKELPLEQIAATTTSNFFTLFSKTQTPA
ncbi:MAG: TatD family hydrolase [Alphaproteobacteria bacterium]